MVASFNVTHPLFGLSGRVALASGGPNICGVIQRTFELSTARHSRGVRVSAILCDQITNIDVEARRQATSNLTTLFLRVRPMCRASEPNDIKGMAIFLAPDASPWVTGR